MSTDSEARKPNVVTGLWKFRPGVAAEDLVRVAGEWLAAEPNRYRHLYVRGCARDQLGLGFQYDLDGETYDSFFERMTDGLKRRFGNDFVGWDLSHPTWVVK